MNDLWAIDGRNRSVPDYGAALEINPFPVSSRPEPQCRSCADTDRRLFRGRLCSPGSKLPWRALKALRIGRLLRLKLGRSEAMTEDEAKMKTCCGPDHAGEWRWVEERKGNVRFCSGSICMAWRTIHTQNVMHEGVTTNYCGLAGKL